MIEGQTVSLVTGCMNRLSSLLVTLPTWLALPELDELVIVDWGSDAHVREVVRQAGHSDPRLRFYEVAGVKHWNFSKCANLGLLVATGEQILRLDADVMLRPQFFADLELVAEDFWTGNWAGARDDNERHLNGTIYTHRASFALVNGYNERLVSYGYDDEDLYLRLWQAGFGRRFLDHDTMEHLSHDDEKRLAFAPETPERVDDLALLVPRTSHMTVGQRLERANAYNRKLAKHEPWTTADWQTLWNVLPVDTHVWQCEMVPSEDAMP